MKKLITIFLFVLLLAASALGQYMKPMLGMQINTEHSLSNGLVGCWLFNEGSGGQVFDLSGNGNTGTFINSPVWVPGKFGSAIDFDKNDDDYIDCGNNITLQPASGLTLYVVFNARAYGLWQGLINSGGDTETRAYGIWFESSGDIEFLLYTSDITRLQAHGDPFVVGTSYSVACTYDSVKQRIYRNGIEIKEGNKTGNIDYTQAVFGLGIGQEQLYTFWDGSIDYVLIYNRAIHPSEIALLDRDRFCFMEPSWNLTLYGGMGPSLALFFGTHF